MNQQIRQVLKKYEGNIKLIEKIIVTLFVKFNIKSDFKNNLIKSLLLKNLDEYIGEIKINSLTFDDLIEVFESIVPEDEKVENGAVYTPAYIKEYIIDKCFLKCEKEIQKLIIGDISCGCGAFLFTLTNKIKSEINISYSDIFRNNLFGLDISENSISRTKILLSLLAIYNGEDKENFEFNLFVGNALNFEWNKVQKIQENNGFDMIVGNPPYVRAKHIDPISKKLLKLWKSANSGNPDLYIPFFEIGIKYLNDEGILGYITVNSFYKSVNARSLRKIIQDSKLSLTIINFGSEKIFKKKSAYTNICFISKTSSKGILYVKTNSKNLLSVQDSDFSLIEYEKLDYHSGRKLSSSKNFNNIVQLENSGKPLSKYTIKNGVATLKNDIYIFKPVSEDENYYFLLKDGKKYSIEKSVCRDIIKPNILKSEEEIENVKEKIIFPYKLVNGEAVIIDSKTFSNEYPKTLEYLFNYKEILDGRDKGYGSYGEWYGFGRTQAITDKGYKLLFPYMGSKPRFMYTEQEDLLIYCGYAIFSDNKQELKILKIILESKVFEYYVKMTSKPYGGGFYSFAKNYVKNFTICDLSTKDREYLLSEKDKNKIDSFLMGKYKVNL